MEEYSKEFKVTARQVKKEINQIRYEKTQQGKSNENDLRLKPTVTGDNRKTS